MTTAVAVCALCGGGLHAARCPQCGHRTEPGWPTPTWSQGTERASAAATWGGIGIDVALIALITALAAVVSEFLGLATPVVWVITVAVALGLGAWVAHRYSARGRALGHRILGARAMVPGAGLPPGHLSRLPRARFFSTAHHDPLDTPSTGTGPAHPGQGLVDLRPPLPTVILPDGRRAAVGARTVIGRYPVPHEPGATLLEINDLSRSMSRAHVALEADSAGQVVAIDLNSANGTAVIVGNTTSTLKPQARVPVPVPCVLRCGSQLIQLVDAGATLAARPGDPTWTPTQVPREWLPA